ncbi:hypothetical protein LXA43DRAFT_986559 [Ganoderma leucocontextum]|nr:hypothetical protein LXA43DRAFT_986559 [Ganoderma leucocontextum]
MSNPSVSTFALAPFDNPAADFIIRSRDGVLFRVRSAIIAEASPVLESMVTLQNPEEQKEAGQNIESESLDGIPIITLAEESDVLDPLLRLCYPTTDPVLADLKAIRIVLAAAMKYRMEEATVLMKNALTSYLEDQPLSVWASACLLRLVDEAKVAALALMGQEISPKAPPELHEISAGDYYRLIKFLRAQGEVPESFRFWEPDPADLEKPKKPKKQRKMSSYQPQPYADIILRSSDGEDFLSHRIILSLESPILRDSIANLSTQISTSGTSTTDSLPVLPMNAPADVLGPVLRQCYLAKAEYYRGLVVAPEHFVALMECAREYEMERVVDNLDTGAHGLFDDAPLLGYLLTARSGFIRFADHAAQDLRNDVYTHGYLREMETTPAHFYHRLVANRRQGAKLVAARVNGFEVAKSSKPVSSKAVHTLADLNESGVKRDGHPWVLEAFQTLGRRVRKADTGFALYTAKPDMLELLKDSVAKKVWCAQCEANANLMVDMHKMWDASSRAFDANEVRSRFP